MRQAARSSDYPPVQLHLEGGTATEDGPAVATARDGRPGADAYTFYVLAEPCTEAAVPHLQAVTDTVLRHLLHRRASITKALTEALTDAHIWLQRGHAAASHDEPPALGMAIAAVRSGEVFVALAGPTLAVLRNGATLEVLSALSARDFRRGALGDRRDPSTRVFRRLLGPGEPVLLAHSLLRRVAPLDVLAAAFDTSPEDLMAAVYRQARHAPRFAAVIATGPALSAGSAPTPDRPHGRPLAAAQFHPLPDPSPGLGPVKDARPPRPAAVAETTPRQGIAILDPSPTTPPRFQPLHLELRTPRRQHSRRARIITIPTGAVMGAAAVGLTVLLAVGIWYAGAQTSASREARATALIEEAASLREQALAAPTRDQTRQQLVQAQRLITEAGELRPEDPRLAPLLEAITASLSDLDGATVLPEPRSLVDLRLAPGSAVHLRSLTVGADAVLVLERSTNRVFRVDLADGGERAQTPPALGAAGNVRTPPDLLRLLWMPRGGLWSRTSLLALDRAGGLWEYRGWPATAPAPQPQARADAATRPSASEEWVRVPLRGAAELGALAGAAGFGGNLYLLDPAASQIWRYVPTDAGFDSERQGVLVAGADIRDAVDFTIDGDVYVLTRAGKVLKFTGGRPQAFPMDGLDKPLAAPAAIMTGPDLKSVYVADTGNHRIVVFDKGGRMQRQILLSDKLPPVAGVVADEARKVLYLLTDRQVVAATLPD